MKLLPCFFTLLLLSSAALVQNAVAAPEAGSPDAVVKALYQYSLDHFEGFTEKSVKADKKWVTPDLYSRMVKKSNQPVHAGDAPDIEGDVFLGCQEAPKKFEIGKTSIDGKKATVEVSLIWPDDKRQCTVSLEQVDGVWKVDDVDYGKDGKLKADVLKVYKD